MGALEKKYASFPILVWAMVKSCEPPTVQAAADRTKLDHGTMLKWLRRRSKSPEDWALRRFAEGFDLPFRNVKEMVARDELHDALNRPVPLPDLSGLRRGPARRALACLVAALLGLGGLWSLPASATTGTTGSPEFAGSKDYVNYVGRRRRRWPIWLGDATFLLRRVTRSVTPPRTICAIDPCNSSVGYRHVAVA